MSKLTTTEMFQAFNNLDAKANEKGLMLLCRISEFEVLIRLTNRVLSREIHRIEFNFGVFPEDRKANQQAEKLELAICEMNAFLDTYKEVEELKAEIQKKKEWLANAEKRLAEAMKEVANG